MKNIIMKMNLEFMKMNMVRRFFVFTALLFPLATGYAQQGGTPQQVNWGEELKLAQEENRALRTVLAAIESIDTARQNELVQWIITDRSIRSRVISALRKSGKNISPSSSADLLITQKPASINEGELNTEVELLRIVIESAGIYGTPAIKKILGEELYAKINSRSGYEHTLISTESPQDNIQYANVNAAIWGGDIVLKSGFGFGAYLGNDYIGLPFWLPGNVSLAGVLKQENTSLILGFNSQLGEAGLTPFGSQTGGGFRIKERKLEGTQGFNAMIQQKLDVLDNPKSSGRLGIGGEIFSAFDPNLSTLSLRANDPQYRTDYIQTSPSAPKKDSLFYLSFSGHGWITYNFGEALKGLYIQAGAGKHSVRAVTVGTKGSTAKPNDPGYSQLQFPKTYNYFDPLVKVGYVHKDNAGEAWGVSVQYCSTLLADGFVRIFNWLNLEAKYSAIVGRDAEKWEWENFVIISPVLKLNF
jgi:hypothetical protein